MIDLLRLIAGHASFDQLKVMRQHLLHDLEVLEADFKEGPVETCVHVFVGAEDHVGVFEVLVAQFDHVGPVEVHVIGFHQLAFLHMSELLTVKICSCTEVGTKVG